MTTEVKPVKDLLTAGDEALADARWEQARASYEAALAREESADGWEGLSWASFWLGDMDRTFAAREQAFRAYRADGNVRRAARMAVRLAKDILDFRGDAAVAAGWLGRTRTLLDGHPPCTEYGWVLIMEGYAAIKVDADAKLAADRGREAAGLGRELANADLEALGLALEGEGLVVLGTVEEGLRRLDEASAVATGEVFEFQDSPGFALCMMITACERIGDFERAAQWCEAMRSIGDRLDGRHLIGVCRSAYGTVLTSRGDWPAAETELLGAIGDLEATRPALAPGGLARLGELRARQGRVDEARELFERARPDPAALVGLGALALDAGDGQAAADAAERTMRRLGDAGPLERIPGLELLARARADLGDMEGASSALGELGDIVADLPSPFLAGRTRLVAGELAEHGGDLEEGRRDLEDALDLFTESAAPYEAALTRLVLARTLSALGRTEAAAAEAQTAREVFATLGAERDVAKADGAGRMDGRPSLGELTQRELEVLKLVARGLGDAEIAEQLVVSPHTVHRHIANVRTKLRLPSRAAAVAYAARAGLL